jgi:ubiquinone/menaquinone biosynthesis C-methylase UbiE
MKKDSSTTSWNLIAEDWSAFAESNDYRNYFLIPNTLELLGEIKGKSILDLGCGEGGYSRLISKMGADVTAIDGSEKLIEIAGKKAEQEGLAIKYFVRNANSFDDIESESFDIVLATMSLMDVEDYTGSIAEVKRVLKKDGLLLMSISHPCFSGKKTGWNKREDGSVLFTTDDYFNKSPWESFINEKHFNKKVVFRHMPLQDFINPLIELGFKMKGFYEPMPTEEQMNRSPRIPRLARVPMFLFMEWLKDQ